MSRSLSMCIAALTLISIFVYNTFSSNNSCKKKLTKEQRIEGLLKQEFEMTKNPFTNEVPYRKLDKIKKEIAQGKYTNGRSGENLIWTERGPNNFGGRTRAITFDPKDPTGNTLFAGGVAGGLWKCTNLLGDYNWEQITSYDGNPAIASIVFDPDDMNRIYVATGEGFLNGGSYRGSGMYISEDNGLSWNQLASTANFEFTYVQKLLFSEGVLFACTLYSGIMRSEDKGLTWEKSLGNNVFGFSERAGDLERTPNGTLYAAMGINGTQDGVYRSKNNGISWENVEFPFDSFSRIELTVAENVDELIYGAVEDEETRNVKHLLKLENGSSDWQLLDVPSTISAENFGRGQAWYDLTIAVDPSNENNIYAGGVDLVQSYDGGESWEQITNWYEGSQFQYVHADQHNIIFLASNPEVAVYSNDGGVYVTQNANDFQPNFRHTVEGYNVTQFYSCAIHPEPNNNYFIGGTQDNGSHIFRDEGINATEEVTGGDGGYCHISTENPDIQITSYTYNSYFITINDWSTYDDVNIGDNEGRFINPTDYNDKHNTLICASNDGKINFVNIFGSDDSLKVSEIAEEMVSAIKVDPNDNDVVFFGTNEGTIFKISDILGSNTVEILASFPGNIRNFDFARDNSEKMLVTYSSYGVASVYISDDYGNNWESAEGNLPDFPVRWGVFSPSDSEKIILGTELGVWSTNQLAGNDTDWRLNSFGLSLTRVDMLDVRADDNTVLAATHGRGVYSANNLNGLVDYDGDGFLCDIDCNDFNNLVYPDAEEVPYNGLDDDCNPETLDDDLDQDGFLLADDCDDNNAAINPAVEEIPLNGIDENCDGQDVFIEERCLCNVAGELNIETVGRVATFGIGWPDCNGQTWIGKGRITYDEATDSYLSYTELMDGQELLDLSFGAYYICYDVQDQDGMPNGDLVLKQDCDSLYYEGISQWQENYGSFNIAYSGSVMSFDWVNSYGEAASVKLTRADGSDWLCPSQIVDNDGDGFSVNEDCDDTNPDVNPDVQEIAYNGIDDDCNAETLDDDLDGDGFGLSDDCDDENAEINPEQEEISYNGIDDDCNPMTLDDDLDGDGFAAFEDCDDNDASINVAAQEIPYNGVDEDCNPLTLDDDLDEDGYGIVDDCDDNNPEINPGAMEIPLNGIDEDCNGEDEQIADLDNDGFLNDIDCDDNNPEVNPEAEEIPYNGIDDDCNEDTLDDDLDGDGYALVDDCDDTNANVNIEVEEIPYNGIDDDCNEDTLDDDLDGDGYALVDDCDDTNANVNIEVEEIPYNGIDDDCNTETLDDDLDGDGYAFFDDCDDLNADVNPDIQEIPYNGIDDDCNSDTLDDDFDGDGYALVDDCDDANANVNIGVEEIPYNGIDDDCNAETLDDDLDDDGFGFSEDCDDNDPEINPDAFDIANNGIDEDCDGEDFTSSVNEYKDLKISINPNPVTDFLQVDSNFNKLHFKLLNNKGQLIAKGTLNEYLDVSDLDNGIYLLQIQEVNSSQSKTMKFLKY